MWLQRIPAHYLIAELISDACLPTEAALSTPRSVYQVNIDDYKTDMVAALNNVKEAQSKQKQYYDGCSRILKIWVGERVLVYMPNAKQGKAWKFARPFHGPYRILELTETNARVCPVHKPKQSSIFVSLDKIATPLPWTDTREWVLVWLEAETRSAKKNPSSPC